MYYDIDPVYWVITILSIIFILSIFFISRYGYNQLNALSNQISNQITTLEMKLASSTLSLQGDISQTETVLSSALEQEKQNVVAIKDELKKEIGSFGEEVDTIAGTVTTLEKLSKTDPELLQKYSKIFFLNEHYEPPRLVELIDQYEYNESKRLQIHNDVWPYLQSMLNQALEENVEIYVFSAFRSFDTQESLKGQYTIIYGQGTANQFSADQGYSEHQLGTTADLITPGIGGTLSDFEKTGAYIWLQNNAHKYGFVLSYPENNSYYIFEPWHWRFVGVKLAEDLHNSGKNFYDLDQREIDEYLVYIFD